MSTNLKFNRSYVQCLCLPTLGQSLTGNANDEATKSKQGPPSQLPLVGQYYQGYHPKRSLETTIGRRLGPEFSTKNLSHALNNHLHLLLPSLTIHLKHPKMGEYKVMALRHGNKIVASVPTLM